MKYLNILFASLLLVSCSNNNPKNSEIPSESIFNLTSEWQNQEGEKLHLKDLQGKTLVVVMIYTHCKAACPILVSKMKKIEAKIDRKYIDNVSLVLVSIDPENDTPEQLKKFAKTNKMEAKQWIFLRSNELATQEFANVLSMKYKKIDPVDFSHSNIITVFDPRGTLINQEEGTEIDVEKVVSTVNKTAQKG
ncbi:MAG: SCO family protein [Bacteroidia bacterium]|jgi:protein SCO1/2|nr:SCO family protein [Bacteroidia bacterium]MCO5254283.1 SCO family protein [Bacteroidota bacterium]